MGKLKAMAYPMFWGTYTISNLEFRVAKGKLVYLSYKYDPKYY